MRTIATIALSLSLSFALVPTPSAQACGGSYSMSPEDFVTSAAYAYLAGREPSGADASWRVESVSISDQTALASIRWNGRLHSLTLVAVDGGWAVRQWRARPLPADTTAAS